MLAPEHIREVFDGLAERYQPYAQAPHHLLTKRWVSELLRARLPRGASVLDVGCGPGGVALGLATEGFAVTAADISPRMLEHVAREARRLRVEVATACVDATRELDRLGRFDAAISIHGPLGYAADPLPLAAAIAARVRDGGTLVFALARGAELTGMVRHPLRALRPLTSRAPLALSGTAGGRALEVFVHDPPALAARLEEVMHVDAYFAAGVARGLPEHVDRRLGALPIVRRLGATTLFVGRARG